MINTLFLICPTDYMEPLIEEYFVGNKYFYTSLGNSIHLSDDNTFGQIKQFIRKRNISKIVFVLKENNKIFKEVINHSSFEEIRSLGDLYHEVKHHKSLVSHHANKAVGRKLCIFSFLSNKVLSLKIMLKDNFLLVDVDAIVFAESYPYFINVSPPTSLEYFSHN